MIHTFQSGLVFCVQSNQIRLAGGDNEKMTWMDQCPPWCHCRDKDGTDKWNQVETNSFRINLKTYYSFAFGSIQPNQHKGWTHTIFQNAFGTSFVSPSWAASNRQHSFHHLHGFTITFAQKHSQKYTYSSNKAEQKTNVRYVMTSWWNTELIESWTLAHCVCHETLIVMVRWSHWLKQMTL